MRDAGHERPSYTKRAFAGAAMLGGFTAFILLIGGGLLEPEKKLLYASLPAILGGALGYISAAADRKETNVGLALAGAIVGVVFGPIVLGLCVAIIDVVAWLLAIPAPLFTDLSWKWWIGSMVLASGLPAASRLSDVASQETAKTSLRYVLCAFFGQALSAFTIALVLWMCFEPRFPTVQQWLLAALAIGACCVVLEGGSRVVRSLWRKTAETGTSESPP